MIYSHVIISWHPPITSGWHLAGCATLKSSLEVTLQRTLCGMLKSLKFILQAKGSGKTRPGLGF